MPKVASKNKNETVSSKNMKRLGPAGVVLVVLIVIAGGAAIYFYQQLNTLKQNPQALAQKEAEALVQKVSKLIVLPEGETPTVATVADPERLKNQPFFANAKKGDKVLIYTNARKAILYNPESNKIVEVAPINIGNQGQAPQPQQQAPPPSPPAR